MVAEILSKSGWGGLRFALDFIEKSSVEQSSNSLWGARPWCILEACSRVRLYLPSLSPPYRQAAAEGKLIWVSCSESLAPNMAQTILESGLCEGILIHGLEQFSKSSPAAIWGRRWQLAAEKGASHLLWLHEKSQAVLGFDLRLSFAESGSFEIRKGHGYFDNAGYIKRSHSPAA